MTIEFRKTTLADVPAVMKIINEAKRLLASADSPQWQNGYPNEETIRQDIEKTWSYVLVVDGIIAGTLALQKTSDKNYQEIFEGSWEKADAPYTTIHRIALADAFRGQKLAYRLIEYAEAETKALGMAQVRVDTHKKNTSMQRIMAHCGFELRGIVYVDDEIDNERLAYQKLL